MKLVKMAPTAVSAPEAGVLLRFAPVAVVLGAGAGLAASIGLWGEDVVQQAFWTETMKIAGVAALPLVAFGARVSRLQKDTFQQTAVFYIVVGLLTALGVIMLCLHNAAVFPKDGLAAPDWQVSAAMMGVGVTVGAIAVGVAAEVFDKIDST